MVKILQAYNFAKQNTFSLSGDVLAATLIDSNRIAISSAEQFIEIYDVGGKHRVCEETIPTEIDERDVGDERVPLKYSLATVGEVVDLIYCEAEKYLLTLEKENVSSPVHTTNLGISCTSSSSSTNACPVDDTKTFVRIYTNFWKFAESKLVELPITVRIASMTTPKAPLVKSIDVIELPLRSSPDLIQCCQTSGSIIVGSKERIYLYEYTQCVHESTQPRFKYIDFLPFKFFVNLNFIPLKLSLAENVIACMNNRYCVAFRIVDVLSGNVAVGADGELTDRAVNRCDLEDIEDVDGDEVTSSESSIVSKTSVDASSRSHNSFEMDSLETTASRHPVSGVPGRTPIDFNVARMVNSACGREFEVDIRSQWEQNESLTGEGSNISGKRGEDRQEIIISPARANEIKIKLVNEAKAMNVQCISSHGNVVSAYSDDNTVQYDIKKLLQICMKTSEPGGGRVVDILRCIDLKALYQRNPDGSKIVEDSEYDMGNQQIPSAITTSKHINRRTLKSNSYNNCIGYALLVATSIDGYLYQFCAQGKWYSDNEKPVATYSFTAPILKVHINDYVIYAVTTESVEIHTSRIGHKLFNNRFEYPSLGQLFPEESSPDVNAPIAVIGLCSFMHVRYVCVNRSNLILISNSALATTSNITDNSISAAKRRSGSEVKRSIAARLLAEAKAKHSLLRSGNSTHQTAANDWTLYNLEVPPVERVIDDLDTIAETCRFASGSNFYGLMEEAHIMLRLSLSLKLEKLDERRAAQLRAKFIENCRKLADFSIRSKKREIHMQATGFYKMCNLKLPDIYENYINKLVFDATDKRREKVTIVDRTADSDNLLGLIYTIKVFLINLGTDRLKISFLNQMVKPFFTPSRLTDQGLTRVPLSLEFLHMFLKYSPSDIPQIMLNSSVLADSISGELISYLKYLQTLTSEENLLLAVMACRMSNYILSQEVIAKTSRRDLATALMKHKNVLFDDSTTLYQRSESIVYTNDRSLKKEGQRRMKRKEIRNQTATKKHVTKDVVSFSDFTETILLASEKTDIIEAVSDVFIHALCVEHSLTLDMVLQLFLNYIASHIGQKGYQTSQKIFVNILQVFYYDFFDVTELSATHDPPSNTPQHSEDECEEVFSKTDSEHNSIANLGGDTNSKTSSSIDSNRTSNQCNRNVYSQLQNQQSPLNRNSNISFLNNEKQNTDRSVSDVNKKGLKILFRMYMGRLKSLSDLMNDLHSADVEQQGIDDVLFSLRLESITFMMRHLQDMREQHQQLHQSNLNQNTTQLYYEKSSLQFGRGGNNEEKLVFVPLLPDYKLFGEEFNQHIKMYIRPIPCLLDRPQYLNRLPPFQRCDFSFPNKDEGESEVRFLGWQNELLTLTLKIQSLLASPKIDREIIEEFISFAQKTPTLIGIDSFLVIVLPKNLAINYMLNFCPEYLWHYGKSNNFTPKQWESLLKKIMQKKDELPNWKSYTTEILNNLVADLNFEELLQCFPNQVIQNRNTEILSEEYCNEHVEYATQGDVFISDEQSGNAGNHTISRDHHPMDNVDESNVFEMTLRKAVSKQRSIALRSMIESTGKQLFDATSNPMYNL